MDTETQDDVIVSEQPADGLAAELPEGDAPPDEGSGALVADGDAVADDSPGEVVVSIGDEPPTEEPHERAPQWVKDLRKSNREKERRIRELEQRLNASTQPAAADVVVGPEPSMDDADIDYDADTFKRKYAEWLGRKSKAEAIQREREEAARKEADRWQAKVQTYEKQRAEMPVADFEDAEFVVKDTLSVTQQGVIVAAAKDKALIVYALGKNPAKLKELAAISDPLELAAEIGRLERDVKVTHRKAVPPPERALRGNSAAVGLAGQAKLDKLKEEAQRTGNYDAYFAEKRRQQNG